MKQSAGDIANQVFLKAAGVGCRGAPRGEQLVDVVTELLQRNSKYKMSATAVTRGNKNKRLRANDELVDRINADAEREIQRLEASGRDTRQVDGVALRELADSSCGVVAGYQAMRECINQSKKNRLPSKLPDVVTAEVLKMKLDATHHSKHCRCSGEPTPLKCILGVRGVQILVKAPSPLPAPTGLSMGRTSHGS